ncbi:hypothetical protein WJX77_004451 [Trebouxia sp. C0004]
MNEYASDHGTATERLMAFDSRYQGRLADEHASASGLDERKLHVRRTFRLRVRKACDLGTRMSARTWRSRPVDENRKQMDRSVISSDDLQELLRVCADTPDRLAATRAAALIKASLLTGFRNCGIIHMTWANLLYRQADQRIVPHAFDILGVGISKHKTNRTGKS